MPQLKRLYHWLLAILVFLIPSNLFFKFLVSSAYSHGLLIDYLIPKIYLSDLVIWILLTLWVIEKVLQKERRWNLSLPKNKLIVGSSFLFFILVIRQFLTPNPVASVWYLLKIVEVLGLGIFVWNHKGFLKAQLWRTSLSCMLLFQSGLALYQFFTQSSFLGYIFLGEPNFKLTLGLATTILANGSELILPYGTTAHPNILGGVLAIGLLLLFQSSKKISFVTFSIGILTLFALFLTQSWSAWLTLGMGIFFLLLTHFQPNAVVSKKVMVTIFTGSMLIMPIVIHVLARHYPQNLSLTRRDVLNSAALSVWQKSPLWGTGLNTFTIDLENTAQSREVVNFIQPVHHLGLLLLSEIGLLGLALILILFVQLKTKKVSGFVLILLPLLTLDHYLLTTQTGLLVLVVFLTYCFQNNSLRK